MGRSRMRILSFWAAFLWFSSPLAHALNPPQDQLWAEIKNSVGVTPGVEVDDLIDKTGGLYVVPVKVKDSGQAVAIATILKPSHKFGGITVQIQVTDGNGKAVSPVVPQSPDQLGDLVRQALKDNGFLKDVVVMASPISPRKIVFPVFSKAVIQFPNDNQADLYKNFNGVAAAVFDDVLVDESGGYSVNPSTSQ